MVGRRVVVIIAVAISDVVVADVVEDAVNHALASSTSLYIVVCVLRTRVCVLCTICVPCLYSHAPKCKVLIMLLLRGNVVAYRRYLI